MTLEDLLQSTLIFSGTPSALQEGFTPEEGQRHIGRLWRWEFGGGLKPSAGGKSAPAKGEAPPPKGSFSVRNVYCTIPPNWVRESETTMKICESIHFHPLRLMAGETLLAELPFSQPHFIKGYLAAGVRIEEDAGDLWKIPMNIESAVMLVFGYRITAPKVVKPLKMATEADFRRFTEPLIEAPPALVRSSDATAPGANVLAQGDERRTVRVEISGIRVIVCVCMAFESETDYTDPGKGTTAVRLMPHVMTLFDRKQPRELSAIGEIHITRPKASTMLEGDKDVPITLCHGMNTAINPLWVTDTNRKLPPASLDWDKIFDYYDAEPAIGEWVTISEPDLPARTVGGPGAVKYASSREPRIEKLARQGEFDNLHLAPSMKMSAADWMSNHAEVNIPIPKDNPSDEARLRLDEILMAPICAHDCLHTHWRWGRDSDKKWVRGWGVGPYEVAGAPMVPKNQRIEAKLTSRSSVLLRTTCIAPPRQWQVLNQNGSTYPLKWSALVSVGSTLLGGFDWAYFYWSLRYKVEIEESPYAGGCNLTPPPAVVVGFTERIQALDLAALRR